MVATDKGLVGRCAVEEGYARLSSQWYVQVEPERPFRMQEAGRFYQRVIFLVLEIRGHDTGC